MKRLLLNKTLILITLLLCFRPVFSESTLKDFGQSPIYSGIDQFGKEFTSASLIGNISLVNFFFSSCEGPCPILMAKIKLILDKAKNCENLRAISISVDPETDTPSILKTYSEKRGYQAPNWSMIQMDKEKVIDVINNGFHLGQGDSIVSHTTRIVIVDEFGSIRAMVGGMDEDAIEKLSRSIGQLCKYL